MNVYIKKQERSHINSLSMHLKQLEKEEKWSLRLAEERKSYEIENRNTTEKIVQTRGWLFEMNNKMDKFSSRLTKEKESGPN